MKLYIMRHGYAGDAENDPKAERERPLLPEGKATVLAMARAMDVCGETPSAVFSSPFTRTTQTADIVAKYFGIQNNPLGDLAPIRPLVPSIEELVGYGKLKRILLVGHVDNTTPAMRNLDGDPNYKWEDLVMAEVRRVRIDRKTLEWRLRWGLKPSDIGLKDRKK